MVWREGCSFYHVFSVCDVFLWFVSSFFLVGFSTVFEDFFKIQILSFLLELF